MKLFGRAIRTDCLRTRRLRLELLERRDLLAVIRIANWNTLNGPNNETDDGYFKTILEAIGNETVQGNTKRLDILALQETDPDVSIGRVANVLNSLYQTTSYVAFATAIDGGGDSTGFVYDTSTLTRINFTELSVGLTHDVMRSLFRPISTFGESDFYAYSTHLKSGTTNSDETDRTNEAAVLRADADALGEGAHVLFAGDLNMHTSAEGAFVNFVGAGAGQVQDVAGAPGNWLDNPAFKSLHSQDPGAAMDDRFDLQLASGEFFNGTGLEYVCGSFHVFGNNGTHALNQPITTGSGASSTVLSALVNASDHLPVVADYQVLISTPNVRITQTGPGTKVTEGNILGYDTYSVVLDTVPAANVTVNVMPNGQLDVGNGAGAQRMLTFTPANALTPQFVVVRAADDGFPEGNHAGSISHTSASADGQYNALSIAGVSVAILDNDQPTIFINEIDVDQESTDAAEFIELYDGGVGNSSLSGLVLVFFNGDDNNDGSYRVIDLNGRTTDANGFFLVGNPGVPGVDLTFPNNTLQNGVDAVGLYRALASAFPDDTSPTGTNLVDAVVYVNSGAGDDAALRAILTPGHSIVNENANNSFLTHSSSRVPDGGDPFATETFVGQLPTPKALNKPVPGGVLITHSGTRVDISEAGGSDSYQIALTTIPTSTVTITVDPDSQSKIGLNGAGVPVVLTFTPADALIPQMITLSAIDDLLSEGNHTSVITHTAVSSDPKYNNLPIANVVASIVDNDAAVQPSIVISEIMYDPASNETGSGVGEWIEIINAGDATVDLSGWVFDDEDPGTWGAIPSGTTLSPHQAAVFFDKVFITATPTMTVEDIFRAAWSIPADAVVVGITWAGLANNANDPMMGVNEALELKNSSGGQIDAVNYDTGANNWPSDSNGPSIYLTNLSLDNSLGINWARSVAGLRGAINPSGEPLSPLDVGSPGRFFLAGDYNVDGFVDLADYAVWRNTVGSPSDHRADGSGPTYGVPDNVVDQFDYTFWRGNFGRVGVVPSAVGPASGTVIASAVEDSGAMPTTPSSPAPAVSSGLSAMEMAWANTDQGRSSTLSPAERATHVSVGDRVVTVADLLLLVGERPAAVSDAADTSVTSINSPREDVSEVDQVFATFDESELVVGFERL